MAVNGYYILSLEANEIFKHEEENGKEIGFLLPKKKDTYYFSFFKNALNNSLDLIELEKSYYSKYRNNFDFSDDNNNKYTLAIINLNFNYTYKSSTKEVGLKALRKHYYENGFNINGIHYVRYKRSSGSSRQGKCLFIIEKLLKHMSKWSECGLDLNKGDLASWEAYKSLSLSSITGNINIPLNGILFINDYKSIFKEEVVSIEEKDGNLIASKKETMISNDIWDGESLLDEGMFSGQYVDKHMLLLRNKFFKSCAFKTRLQKWFKDNNICSVEQLRSKGFVTLADDIKQIVMVTTPSSMKFLKFLNGHLNEENVRSWINNIDEKFGVVKFDKRTKFFNGKLVRSSYQFINTIDLNEEQVEEFLKPSKDYISKIRDDYDFMRYHFNEAFKREKESEFDDVSDGLAERGKLIFKLMQKNYDFKDTKLYYNFRNEVVENLKNMLKRGQVLVSGTNATLFGNGPEMLLAISGEFDLHDKYNKSRVLNKGEISCNKFKDGEKLVCARSPHITMGNVYCATNNISDKIWSYFDLGENIVCINSINENIQQRLNGCDFDSDAMLITNEKILVDAAYKHIDKFKVPVCNISSTINRKISLAELDHNTSENKIGHIVNLSQKLNCILWDKYKKGDSHDSIEEIYFDICKLAVLSGIEIDKAKRSFDNVNVSKEINLIVKKYHIKSPMFFKEIDFSNQNFKDAKKKRKDYLFYNAPMEYLYKNIFDSIDYRKGKEKNKKYVPILELLKVPSCKNVSTVYTQKDRAINICEEYKTKIKNLYKQLRNSDEDEKELIYERIHLIKEERKEKILKCLSEEYVLYLVIKHYEKEDKENWHLYAPLLESDLFEKMLKPSKEKMKEVYFKENGEYNLYNLKFAKK